MQRLQASFPVLWPAYGVHDMFSTRLVFKRGGFRCLIGLRSYCQYEANDRMNKVKVVALRWVAGLPHRVRV
jgi:hypothetical protein